MITVISSTNRLNSNTLKVAREYVKILQSNSVKCQLLDFCELPKGFLFDECFGNRTAEFDHLVKQNIDEVGKFIFVMPEYNGSFPGILKGFIDAVPPRSFSFKKAALVGVSTGHAGNARGIDSFTNVLNYLKVSVYFDKPKLSSIDKIIDASGNLNEFTQERLKNQVAGFLSF
ncbi:MAG: NADPH-dependent FMN reductase [Flavobacteriales bacterium]